MLNFFIKIKEFFGPERERIFELKSSQRQELEDILQKHAKNLSEYVKMYIKPSNYFNIHLHLSVGAVPALRYFPNKQKFICYDDRVYKFVDIRELGDQTFWNVADNLLIWIDKILDDIQVNSYKRKKVINKIEIET